VSKADLQAQDREAAWTNPSAEITWFGARTVAAELPSSLAERRQVLFEAGAGGRDLQHFPQRYRNYASQAVIAAGKARPLAELREFNPDDKAVLDAAITRSGVPEARLGFLPLKGPVGDAAMLVDTSSGAIIGMAGLRPWR